MKWKTKKTTWVFLYIKYSKFWSVSLEHFVERKPLIYEEWITSYSFISYIEQCIDGAQCDVESFSERRSYMETSNNLTGFINHGENIQFTCRDSRILTVSQIFSRRCNLGNKFYMHCLPPKTLVFSIWGNCATYYLVNYLFFFFIFSPLCILPTSFWLIAIMEKWWKRVVGQMMKM